MRGRARMTAMTTNRQTKRTASTRMAKGKDAVQKGTRFEDNVAELYRLLGADFIQCLAPPRSARRNKALDLTARVGCPQVNLLPSVVLAGERRDSMRDR